MERAIVKKIIIVKDKPKFVYNLEIPKNHNYFINDVLLHNSQNIILDESSLIPDLQYAGIVRMLGGFKDNFLFEIGNPFYRNHFYKASKDPKYKKILIDYKQGIEEGRIQPEFIEEMRSKAFFSVMYECKFPDEEQIDAQGYTPLLTEKEFEPSIRLNKPFGEAKMGVDIAAGGRNKTIVVLRWDNHAKLELDSSINDTMSLVGWIRKIAEEYKVKDYNIAIDATGVGNGTFNRLRELGLNIEGVILGEKADISGLFYNRRAELYWRTREWIKNGGTLESYDDFSELLHMKYKIDSDKRVKMIKKEDLQAKGIASPDKADALMLTFALGETTYEPYKTPEEQRFYKKLQAQEESQFALNNY